MPPPDQFKRLDQQAIAEKHPLLGTVYGAMDGLKIPIQEAHDDLVQGRYYNGWLHGHYLTNLLLFTPDGRIRMAWMGAPGSIHDSTLAKMGGIYEAVERIYREDGGQVAADSAFSQYRSDAIIRSAPTGRDRSAGAREARMGTIRGQATSLCHSVSSFGGVARGYDRNVQQACECETSYGPARGSL